MQQHHKQLQKKQNRAGDVSNCKFGTSPSGVKERQKGDLALRAANLR